MESTGKMTTYDKARVHIEAGGAKKVLISAPSKDCLNVVYGVNHSMYRGDVDVISNASCTVSRPVVPCDQRLGWMLLAELMNRPTASRLSPWSSTVPLASRRA